MKDWKLWKGLLEGNCDLGCSCAGLLGDGGGGGGCGLEPPPLGKLLELKEKKEVDWELGSWTTAVLTLAPRIPGLGDEPVAGLNTENCWLVLGLKSGTGVGLDAWGVRDPWLNWFWKLAKNVKGWNCCGRPGVDCC